jgi:hypothetical protein
MKMFVILQAFPSVLQSRGQMDGLQVGMQQILPVAPTRYDHYIAVQSEDTLKYLNNGNRLYF